MLDTRDYEAMCVQFMHVVGEWMRPLCNYLERNPCLHGHSINRILEVKNKIIILKPNIKIVIRDYHPNKQMEWNADDLLSHFAMVFKSIIKVLLLPTAHSKHQPIRREYALGWVTTNGMLR